MDGIKRRSPGPDSFKDACRTSYDNVASAAGAIGAAAAAGGEKARNIVNSAAADAARLGSSSLAPVRDAYRHAWSYTSWASGEADRVVRVEAPRRIAEWMPEADQRRRMLEVLKEVGISAMDIAISESARCVPGGPPLYRVIKKGAAEIAKIQREGAKDPSSKPSEADHVDGGAGAAAASAVKGGPPSSAAGIHRPEDVIALFLREGFKGREFLDALIVPVPRGKSVGGSPAGTSDSAS